MNSVGPDFREDLACGAGSGSSQQQSGGGWSGGTGSWAFEDGHLVLFTGPIMKAVGLPQSRRRACRVTQGSQGVSQRAGRGCRALMTQPCHSLLPESAHPNPRQEADLAASGWQKGQSHLSSRAGGEGPLQPEFGNTLVQVGKWQMSCLSV